MGRGPVAAATDGDRRRPRHGPLVRRARRRGSGDRGDVNQLLFQYFLNYNKPNGWYYTSAPIITANWEADSGNKWTVPVGGGVGKVYRIGKRPVNANVQAYYNIEKPDFAADWSIRVQMVLLFPK